MAQWSRLKELCQQAEELPRNQRGAFLEAACGGDPDLLREAQALLAAGEAAGSFLEAPPHLAWEACAEAMVGGSAGHYRLESLLGRGGMGLVFRAKDTRLGRTVALKLLRPETAQTPAARLRLLREAQAASALKHPNIVTVYEVGEADGRDFLIMEFVEGNTLAERIVSGPLAFAEALDCAIQVASALEAAHRAGVLHRDLKPQNVMLDAAGVVKVVDFGLAKLMESAETEPSPAGQTNTGAVFGTAPYMSPEQAEGRPADARSDVFSFGALFYELLSGRRAFPGASTAATLAAVLRDHPQPLDSPAWNTISRCLEKDMARRFQSAGELRERLEQVRAGGRGLPWKWGRKWVRYAACILPLAALAAGLTWWRVTPRSFRQQTSAELVQLTVDPGLTTEPALSRDGRLLAYASDRGNTGHLEIFVQPINGGLGAARRVTNGAADQHEPAFSPDGARIAYRSEQGGGGIWTIALAGGSPKLLMRAGRRPRYSPDGKWIACWTGQPGIGDPGAPGNGRIFLIPADGGEARQLLPGFTSVRYPLWAPDGRHILFAGTQNSDIASHDWWVTDLSGGPDVRTGAGRILADARLAGYGSPTLPEPQEWSAQTGGVLFASGGARRADLWELPISQQTWKTSSVPTRVTLGTGLVSHPALAAGRTVFAGLASQSSIWSLHQGQLTRVTDGAVARGTPSLPVSGNPMVTLQLNGFAARDLRSGSERVLLQLDHCFWARLAPSGSHVIYVLEERGLNVAYAIPVAGGQPAQRLGNLGQVDKVWDVSSKASLALVMSEGTPRRVTLVDLRSGRRTVLLSHPSWNLYWAAFSADASWVTFTARTGPEQSRVFAARLGDGEPIDASKWVQVTEGSGNDTAPRWSTDGKRIYYFSDRDGFRCIWSAGFEKGRPTAPVPVQHFHQGRLSLARIPVAGLELGVARDRLVFELAESFGNIYQAR
jgi:eukaryotic-like serine/threonine-protein kinase